MAKNTGEKQNLYLVQKVVLARNIHEALTREQRGKIVDITLTDNQHKKLSPAIGFTWRSEGTDAIGEAE